LLRVAVCTYRTFSHINGVIDFKCSYPLWSSLKILFTHPSANDCLVVSTQ
jgi:hypothetical protein